MTADAAPGIRSGRRPPFVCCFCPQGKQFRKKKHLTRVKICSILNIVQYEERRRYTEGDGSMNKVVTSAKEILKAGRELAEQKGMQAVNMRSVAAACGVAVGSVYYYFPSKAELTAAIVRDIWEDILGRGEAAAGFDSFTEHVSWLYERLRSGTEGAASFFAEHSLGFGGEAKGKGKRVMKDYLGRVEGALAHTLRRDRRVRSGVFSEELTEEAFAGFVLRSILGELSGGEGCGLLLAVIRRALY